MVDITSEMAKDEGHFKRKNKKICVYCQSVITDKVHKGSARDLDFCNETCENGYESRLLRENANN